MFRGDAVSRVVSRPPRTMHLTGFNDIAHRVGAQLPCSKRVNDVKFHGFNAKARRGQAAGPTAVNRSGLSFLTLPTRRSTGQKVMAPPG